MVDCHPRGVSWTLVFSGVVADVVVSQPQLLVFKLQPCTRSQNAGACSLLRGRILQDRPQRTLLRSLVVDLVGPLQTVDDLTRNDRQQTLSQTFRVIPNHPHVFIRVGRAGRALPHPQGPHDQNRHLAELLRSVRGSVEKEWNQLAQPTQVKHRPCVLGWYHWSHHVLHLGERSRLHAPDNGIHSDDLGGVRHCRRHRRPHLRPGRLGGRTDLA